MSDEIRPQDRDKRLQTLISMGFSYSTSKLALEKQAWNVDDAAASIIAQEGSAASISAHDSSVKGKNKKQTAATSPAAAPRYDRAEVSPDAKVIQLSRQHRSYMSFLKARQQMRDDGGPKLSPVSMAEHSLRRDAAASKTQQYNNNNDGVSHPYLPGIEEEDMDIEEGMGRNAPFSGPGSEYHDDVNPLRTVPGAFREGLGCNEDSTTGVDSLTHSQTPAQHPAFQAPYMAVAEVVRVPELVMATLQEHVSAITPAPMGPVSTAPWEAPTGAVEGSFPEQETRWRPRRRTLYILLVVGLLVLIGLASGLGVSWTRSQVRDVGQPVGAVGQGENTTASPPLTTPIPDGNAPTIEPLAPSSILPSPPTSTMPTTTVTTEETTKQPMKPPTSSPTMSTSTLHPTSLRPMASPTLPPTIPVTENPTHSPTALSTIPATHSPTQKPTLPATEMPTTISPLPSPTEPLTERPTSSPVASTTTSPMPLPTVLPTNSEELRLEDVQMILNGVSSNLDGNAIGLWADVTTEFILNEVDQVLHEQSESTYYNYWWAHVEFISQMPVDNNEGLELSFSVEFKIESSLSFHDLESYVEGAFDSGTKRSDYIDELKARGDSSFEDVSDVEVSVYS